MIMVRGGRRTPLLCPSAWSWCKSVHWKFELTFVDDFLVDDEDKYGMSDERGTPTNSRSYDSYGGRLPRRGSVDSNRRRLGPQQKKKDAVEVVS